jgi:AraC family transcriptional regulator
MRGHFGASVRTRSVGAFRVAELDATVPAADVPEHTHHEAHFVLVLRGAYASTARHMPESSDAPLLVFNPPGTTHRDHFARSGGRFLSLSLPAWTWAGAPQARKDARPQRLGFTAMLVAWRLRAELLHWDVASPLQLECASHELLAHAASHAPERGPRPRWLDRIRERLDPALPETPSLGELARDAGVHPVHLSRAFRRHFGCSPGSWLREARLQRAAAMLAKGRCSIADAAHEAGFYDQSHLHRTLQALTGLSPRTLRDLVPALD